jgi:hypothetical protein
VLELVLGVVEYREFLFLGTTWVHHSLYLPLMTWLLAKRMTGAFTSLIVNELPTFMLAVGTLHRPWRTDLAFGIVYGATRLAFTLLAFGLHIAWSTERSFALLNTAVCAAHAVFFAQWLKSYRRLLATARKKEAAASAPPPTSDLASGMPSF